MIQIGIVLALLLAAGCAKQGRPMGGPVDRTAPMVTGHAPPTDATAVDLSTGVTIDFSEEMDRKRVEEAVFVAPNAPLNMSWKGRQLRIAVGTGLTMGRTYVVTVGTDARDLRGNRLQDSYSFAFATGDRLDSGELKGRIVSADDDVQRGAYVWAYDLQTFDGRTALDAPAFVTQTGADGSYRFERLAQGRYRVVGFVDGNRNQRPDPGEVIALPARDVDVAGEGVTSAGDQRLAQRDVQPKVVQASVVDRRRILLVFDHPVDAADLQIGLGPLAIKDIHSDPLDARRLHIRTGVQQEGKTYRLIVQRADGDLEVPDGPLRGTARQDTKAPTISRQQPDGSVAAATAANLFFSEAMDTSRVPMGWTSVDSTSAPGGEWAWHDGTDLIFRPDTSFAPGPHHMELDLRDLRDRAGNTMADSTVRIHFDLLDSAGLATITGQCIWPDETDGLARIHLSRKSEPTASTSPDVQVDSQVDSQVNSTVDSLGHFHFAALVPVEYVLTAWFDRDADGIWDAGQIEPYRAAEPYVLHGTVKVEAGDTVSLVVPQIEVAEEVEE
jgi:hypothetical protein